MRGDDVRIIVGLAVFYVVAVCAMWVTDRVEKRWRTRRILGRKH